MPVLVLLEAAGTSGGSYRGTLHVLEPTPMCVQVALGADEVPAAKPEADGLLLCCQRLGVEPENSVYVGDSPPDGQAARAAGLKSIGVLWGAGEEATLTASFDVVVPDVPELIIALRDQLAAVAEEAH